MSFLYSQCIQQTSHSRFSCVALTFNLHQYMILMHIIVLTKCNFKIYLIKNKSSVYLTSFYRFSCGYWWLPEQRLLQWKEAPEAAVYVCCERFTPAGRSCSSCCCSVQRLQNAAGTRARSSETWEQSLALLWPGDEWAEPDPEEEPGEKSDGCWHHRTLFWFLL